MADHLESAAKLSESFLPFEVVGSAAPTARPGAAIEIAPAGGVLVRLPVGTEPRYVGELFRALR